MTRIVSLLLAAFTIISPAYLHAETARLDGLKASAKIIRDVHGIAHIIANNEHDLFFLQGYVHAQDRLFQMDVSRRRGSGTLAELLGASALESDILFRTIGLRRAAKRSIKALSTGAQSALDAYAAGVNTYVSTHALPPEYTDLELTHFEPWIALDGVTVGKLLTFNLSFDVQDINRTLTLLAYQETGEQIGFDGTALFFDDLFRSAPFDPQVTIPGISANNEVNSFAKVLRERPDKIDSEKDKLLGLRYIKKLRAVPYMRQFLDDDEHPASNEWVVDGAHTSSGFPILANDPHLFLTAPSTFYPIHLRAGNIDAIGSGFAGIPTVVLGHNRNIAWGATVNSLDVVDIFQERIVADEKSPSGLSTIYKGQREPVVAVAEVFRVNSIGDGIADHLINLGPDDGMPAATLIVPRRNNGPIIELDQERGIALSVQYTGFSPTRELDAFFIWNKARSLDDFIEGLQYFDVGSQNFVYADRDGNIAYYTSAEAPIREDLQAGSVAGLPPYFIRNGTGGNEWLPVKRKLPGQAIPYEILSFEEMPKIINPPSGWIVNANNDPIGVTLDNNPINEFRTGGGIYYLSQSYGSMRAARLKKLLQDRLANGGKVTFDEMQVIQADTVLRDAEVFVPYILQAFENSTRKDANLQLVSLATSEPLREAVERLIAWDYTTPSGVLEGFDANDVDGERAEPTENEIAASVAATLYAVWRSRVVRNVIDTPVESLGLPVPSNIQTLSALRYLLDNFETNQGYGTSGLNFFKFPGVESAADRRDVILLKSLADALTLLSGEFFAGAFAFSSNQNDYRWGKLHRVVFEHPLGEPFSIPPANGDFPSSIVGLQGIPADGGFQTVDSAHHNIRAQGSNDFMFSIGPASRVVSELGVNGGIRAESIWPGGVSGVLGDDHYLDMLMLWLTNDTIQLVQRKRDLRQPLVESTKVFIP